jgi:hypothetical protein
MKRKSVSKKYLGGRSRECSSEWSGCPKMVAGFGVVTLVGVSREGLGSIVSSADRTNFVRVQFLCFVPQRVSFSFTSLENHKPVYHFASLENHKPVLSFHVSLEIINRFIISRLWKS